MKHLQKPSIFLLKPESVEFTQHFNNNNNNNVEGNGKNGDHSKVKEKNTVKKKNA